MGVCARSGHECQHSAKGLLAMLSGVDDETPKNFLEGHAQGHVRRQPPSWITIYHDADHPSCLLLPVTNGNIIGTYMSGGNLYFDIKK